MLVIVGDGLRMRTSLIHFAGFLLFHTVERDEFTVKEISVLCFHLHIDVLSHHWNYLCKLKQIIIMFQNFTLTLLNILPMMAKVCIKIRLICSSSFLDSSEIILKVNSNILYLCFEIIRQSFNFWFYSINDSSLVKNVILFDLSDLTFDGDDSLFNLVTRNLIYHNFHFVFYFDNEFSFFLSINGSWLGLDLTSKHGS